MKIKIDDKELFEIKDHHLKGFLHIYEKEIHLKEIEDTIKWHIQSYCSSGMKKIIDDWLPRMKQRYDSLPTKDEDLINLITSQDDYLSFSEKQMLEKMKRDSTFKVV